MSYTPIVVEIIATFCLVAFILYQYGDLKKQNTIVTFAVLIAWYFSFLIIFVLPLDVSSTVYRQCLNNLNVTLNESSVCEMPLLFVPGNLLPNLWRVVYWTSQFLTWLVLPLMQSYAKAGEFTVKGRLKSALVDNAIYYGSYLFICGVLLVYIALKPGLHLDGQKLKAIASSASNTWGLLLLVGLLGYALVDIPRSLWLSSKPGYRLQRAYFKAAKISADKCEAEETLEDVLESIQWMKCCVTGGDPLYQEMKTVLDKVPRSRSLTKRNPAQSASAHADSMISPSLRSLVRIHQLLIKSLHTCKRTETQWKLAVRQVILLEDIERNRHSRDRTFKHTFPGTKPLLSPTFEWYWRCLMMDYLYQLLGLTYALFSAAVLWSEVTFFNASPVLSIFAIIINFSKEHYDYFTIDIFSTVIIGYLCYCAYSTVFKIRVLNYYYLAPHHQTDEQSLIFAGMMLCRLTPPMCLNFLGLIHMDSHIIKQQLMETYYTQVMGHMEVVSIVSDGFNVYFPMAVLAFCMATYFSLGSRLLSFIGFHQFLNDHELTAELIDEGRELINREKRRRQRSEETAERRREYNERFGIGKEESGRGVSSPPEGAMINSGVMRDSSSRSNLLTSSEPVADYQTDYRHQPPRGLFDDI